MIDALDFFVFLNSKKINMNFIKLKYIHIYMKNDGIDGVDNVVQYISITFILFFQKHGSPYTNPLTRYHRCNAFMKAVANSFC